MIFCNQCGTQNVAGATFCSQCGTAIGGAQPAPPVAPSYTPPAAPPAAAQPGFAPPAPAYYPSLRYGGFWIRFVAAIVDAIVVQVVVFPLSFIVGAMIGIAGLAVSMPRTGVQLVNVIIGATIGFCGAWIYEAAMESSSRQATLGKMIFSMKVTDLNGNRISFARATGRHFAKYISAAIFFIGYIMAGFTERKQALHDMVAGTLVIRM